MSKRPSDYRSQWDALAKEAAALAVSGKAANDNERERHEAEVTAVAVSQEMVAHGVWETTAQDMADVLLLAEIVWTFFWGFGTFPQLPADIDDRDQRHVAVAYLVRGIADAARAQAGTAEGGKA